MASPVGVGFYSRLEDGKDDGLIIAWVIAEYRIYEDAKGILRWQCETIEELAADQPAGINERGWLHPEDVWDRLSKYGLPVLIHRRAWGTIEPNSAVTQRFLYILFPELSSVLKMPFPVMKDWVKERL